MSPESTRRREIDAAPTTLGDGRRWGLARPATRFRPAIARGLDALGRPTETVHLAVEYGYPAGIHRAIDRLRSECQGGDARGQHVALAALGVALLVRAHDVPDSFAAGLFEADPDQLREDRRGHPGCRHHGEPSRFPNAKA